jgi:hypothetical protein
MDVSTRLDYFHKEHEDFLRFLDDWERTLETLASKDQDSVRTALSRLREMQPNLKAIESHCSSEELNVEDPYRNFLEKGQLEQLKKEHLELAHMVTDMLSELRFATLYETERARSAGHELAGLVRRHMRFEEKLLEEIADKLSAEAEEKVLLRYTQAPE